MNTGGLQDLSVPRYIEGLLTLADNDGQGVFMVYSLSQGGLYFLK